MTIQILRKTHLGWLGSIVAHHERRYESGDADRQTISLALDESGGWKNCYELYALAAGLGNEKIAAIVHSMLNPRSRYARATRKQILAVTDAVLTRYGTARAALAAAMQVSESELMDAGRRFDEE